MSRNVGSMNSENRPDGQPVASGDADCPQRLQQPPAVSRWDAAVKPIIHRWRRLTGGGAPTLIACSGGADSSALALALRAAGAQCALAHVLHDLRPKVRARADRDRVADLAAHLGVPFAERAIAVPHDANPEAAARKLRYKALADIAHDTGHRFVATAHHADDQLETFLMALLRGAGPAGLSGIAPSRPINHKSRCETGRTPDNSLMLIRPMLGATRAEAHAICHAADWRWAEDETNADTDRFRAALRARVLPILAELRPDAAHHAVDAADTMRDLAALVQDSAHRAFVNARVDASLHAPTRTPRDLQIESQGDCIVAWSRNALRAQLPTVLIEGLRSACIDAARGSGDDRFTRATLARVVSAITDHSTDPRTFTLAHSVTISVTAHTVTVNVN